ncbi:DUF645 family protein, partial [Vibrio cholerae]|nr:DUF645 family protein [Vibrio cholerae]ELN9002551.1 DUF645 family protein [Vibrio cholerae]HDI3250461.1 DUF645 family protein [Vibrio cholerae]
MIAVIWLSLSRTLNV